MGSALLLLVALVLIPSLAYSGFLLGSLCNCLDWSMRVRSKNGRPEELTLPGDADPINFAVEA